MQRRIIGSYQDSPEVVREIERLMREGYVGEEILIITDNKTSHQKDLENLSLVEVDSINPSGEMSFWEKSKEAFSFGKYDSDSAKSPLTEYGVDENQAASYNDSLKDGNILLLVNHDAPAHSNTPGGQNDDAVQSQDKDSVSSKESMKEDYQSAPGEEETFDPSKAQSSREDKLTEEETAEIEQNEFNETVTVTPADGAMPSDSAETKQKVESEVATGENENRLDDKEAPQLTGDETSVNSSEGSHEYPDNVNNGPVNSTDSLINKHVQKKGS